MKKLLVASLVSALIILPTPTYASSDDNANVTLLRFEKIKSYMESYNPQIEANYDKLSDIKVPSRDTITDLENLKGLIDLQIAGYGSEQDKITNSVGMDAEIKEQLINLYDELILIAQNNKDNLQKQIESLDETIDNAADARYKAILQTDMGNKQIIWGAEQLYLSYNTLENQISQQRTQLSQLNNQANAMKLRAELGLVAGGMVRNLDKSVKELETAINAMVHQQQSLKEQLNIMLGQDYDVDLEIKDSPEVSLSTIRDIDFEEDYEEAVWNSYAVRLQDESWQEEAEARKFKADMWTAYQTILDKQDALDLENYKLEDLQMSLEEYELRYDLGLVSALAYKDQVVAQNNQVTKVQMAKDDLFKAYRKYEWFKDGLTLN